MQQGKAKWRYGEVIKNSGFTFVPKVLLNFELVQQVPYLIRDEKHTVNGEARSQSGLAFSITSLTK